MDGATGSAPRAPISLTAAERDALLRLLPPAVHCDDADCPLEDPLSALVDATRERLEGNTLEARYGEDSGNGWAYKHALGKVRKYQELLLRTAFEEPDAPSAPSVAQLEMAG